MKRRQRGVTMIGWICLLTPLAICLYAGMRVTPEYLNYYKVLQAMKETAVQLKSDDTLTANTVRNALEKRFDTGYIDHPTVKEIVIAKGANGWTMMADYETVAPMFGNLHLLLQFKTSVVIN
jgi:hypothetical protein